MANLNGVKLTYLGHSTFLVETPGGKTILIDPWVQGNPKCPAPFKSNIGKLDYMLLTHGHYDHIGDAVEIGKATGALAVAVFEIGQWLEKKGLTNVADMNKGGTFALPGSSTIRVTMVHADHSCGISDGDQIVYGGEAAGYVVEFENGLRLYHAGDTAVFGDMRTIADLYQPDIALLPIGDRYVMSPREAALAAKLLNVKTVIPMHFGTFPILTGTPQEFKKLLDPDIELIVLAPGECLE